MEDYPNHETPPPPLKDDQAKQDVVWTFRGYQLKASEFTTAMVHFFRAEVSRANVWRQRLDATTNWAVVTTGAAISFVFSQATGNHFVLLLNSVLITMFLVIEARRYRYYELWSFRVRLMETDFFAAMLVPPFRPSSDWAEGLAENLLHPQFPITYLEAIGRRLRRNYLWIYFVLLISWVMKLWLHPVPALSAVEFFQRAAIGPFSGSAVILATASFYFLLFALSLFTVGLQQAAGEVLPRYGEGRFPNLGIKKEPIHTGRRAWFRPSRRRPQFLVLIITDKVEEIAARILKEMRRGVTAVSGKGMYTGAQHQILMCALTVTEIPHLKSLVAETDAQAFIIVTPAQEVLGRGFIPLREEEEPNT